MRRMLLVLLIAFPAFGKSLHWKSIDVQARLDADGRLRVVERQQMVFDGDWNGGERNFNLQGSQRVELHRLALVDDGRELPLDPGNLEKVDQYDFVTGRILRWRSRLESDPPFENRELTYVLDYTYDRILTPHEGRLWLWHDFGLPERAGFINQFTLKLEFDPVWTTAAVSEMRTELAPGQGVVVQRALALPAGAWPEGVPKPLPAWSGWAALLLFFAAVAVLVARFVRGEAEGGRFGRVAPELDPELMELKPELLGAMWDAGVGNTDLSDHGVGPAEVAAVLARLTQEGKIASRVEGKVLHMRLLVPRSDFTGYERGLIAQIFVDGEEIDTKKLKKHYKGSGFDPAKTIRYGIHTAIADVFPRWSAKTKRVRAKVHVMTLVGLAVLLVGLMVFGESEDLGELLVVGVIGAIFGLLACATAYANSRAITSFARAFRVPTLLLMIPMALLALGALRAFPARRLSAIGLAVCALWLLAILRLVLDLLKIPDTREVIAVRKRVLAVRQYFKEQLRQPQPALRDEWFPYLIAFGLGRHADRWFRAFGSTVAHTTSSSWSGSSSGSSSATGWTGGGGAFGGAGATGTWAAAAGAIAAGAPAPSSGGSGGGGGGSSSGGGGGGGW